MLRISMRNQGNQSSGVIYDSAGNAWTILNGQVAKNGVADSSTSDVLTLAYVNGYIWQMAFFVRFKYIVIVIIF